MKEHNTIYIYPTDTVWGIGGSIYSESAFLQVMQIKKVQFPRPVSVLVSSLETLAQFVSLDDLPFSTEVLQKVFASECSLGVPLELLKQSVPTWIYQGSDSVLFRCLAYPWILQIVHDLGGAPIVTTSLNLTSDPPISDWEGAERFWQTYAADAKFIHKRECLQALPTFSPSGQASTIIFLKKAPAGCSGKQPCLQIVREGRFAAGIAELLLA
ncbi:MAG: Sua5/YciO/YrdC/YwlC family protein [Oligoflexia bacterium]|nr:Sua5/YciO/YrdC/YwlC family protein [Oligoflexia bacterium]